MPADRRSVPAWVWIAGLIISVIGLGVSIYLTVEHYTGNATLACSSNGTIDCAKVTTSPESKIIGIPVAVLGLPFFVAMVAANLPAAWRSTLPWLRLGRLLSVGVGIVFVLYLVYVELFRVDAICLWCTSVHVLTFLLLVIVLLAEAGRDSFAP